MEAGLRGRVGRTAMHRVGLVGWYVKDTAIHRRRPTMVLTAVLTRRNIKHAPLTAVVSTTLIYLFIYLCVYLLIYYVLFFFVKLSWTLTSDHHDDHNGQSIIPFTETVH